MKKNRTIQRAFSMGKRMPESQKNTPPPATTEEKSQGFSFFYAFP